VSYKAYPAAPIRKNLNSGDEEEGKGKHGLLGRKKAEEV
jgi:hypothetical protein